jgi:hypothetical protein
MCQYGISTQDLKHSFSFLNLHKIFNNGKYDISFNLIKMQSQSQFDLRELKHQFFGKTAHIILKNNENKFSAIKKQTFLFVTSEFKTLKFGLANSYKN